MSVKVIPITEEYRQNYDLIFRGNSVYATPTVNEVVETLESNPASFCFVDIMSRPLGRLE